MQWLFTEVERKCWFCKTWGGVTTTITAANINWISNYYMPAIVVSTAHVLSHLVITKTLGGQDFCLPYFTIEETKVLDSEIWIWAAHFQRFLSLAMLLVLVWKKADKKSLSRDTKGCVGRKLGRARSQSLYAMHLKHWWTPFWGSLRFCFKETHLIRFVKPK